VISSRHRWSFKNNNSSFHFLFKQRGERARERPHSPLLECAGGERLTESGAFRPAATNICSEDEIITWHCMPYKCKFPLSDPGLNSPDGQCVLQSEKVRESMCVCVGEERRPPPQMCAMCRLQFAQTLVESGYAPLTAGRELLLLLIGR
jgi:hypothetical protein